MSRITFSKKRAEEIAKAYNGKIWVDRDAFGQTIYIVKW